MVNEYQSDQITNDRQQDLADYIALAVMMMTVPMIDGMAKAFVEPELEKRLGRPLTREHWNFYWKEKAQKQHWHWYYRQAADREIIRRFVWEGDI